MVTEPQRIGSSTPLRELVKESESRTVEIEVLLNSISRKRASLDQRKELVARWTPWRRQLLGDVLIEKRTKASRVLIESNLKNALQSYLSELDEEEDVYSKLLILD